MKKAFWQDPCQHTLTTKVITVKGNEVLLPEIIAYSFSGGQENPLNALK